jgi:exopolysaccharide biosynthesis WecB/TagA/CpsF family protein
MNFRQTTYTDCSLIHALFSGEKEDFLQALISLYEKDRFVIVNYLYFASAMKYRLFEYQESIVHQDYKKALQKSTFFLADGIALQVFAFVYKMFSFAQWPWFVHNLNGTDLTPYLLNELPKHGTVSVYLYNLYDPRIGKTEEWIEKATQSFQVRFPEASLVWNHAELYAERGSHILHEDIEEISSKDTAHFKIFLNCTGSPFQEIWAEKNREFLEKHGFIVLNSWGVIDFISGFEKRAPGLLVKLRVFETFWRILCNPRKNLPKFLSMFWVFRVMGKSFLWWILGVFRQNT